MEFNPYDPELQHNPYPCFKRMRDEAPVYYNRELNFYALTRYDDVLAAFLDPTTFISGNGVTIEGADRGLPFLISTDPPDHTWLRKLFSRLFTPRRVAELKPFMRRIASQYLDAAVGRQRFDIMERFAWRFPLDVISELIGLPAELREPYRHLAHRAGARQWDPVNGSGPTEDAIAAIIESLALLQDLVVERRKQPREDIISMLITAEVADESGNTRRLNDDLITMQFQLLANAGHETVTGLIGNGAIALWWHPEQRAALVRDPSLIPAAVDEMLRWDNPAPPNGRWTTKDVELHGVTIPKDSRVMLYHASANHDERCYENPELFDIHRVFHRPVVFGFGIHRCLGANLARLEAQVAFEELLARFPTYEIDETGVVRPPAQLMRGLDHLPLILQP
ncbi:cytochrome [Mycobacterium mantenii]|uniref:Cytochrome n=1 Tax=Mycobacterium mantenii TaxID=560555 RepID=A0A1X0F876_MYCNT|nr:cytochrome [Mycobacterium mantenii]